MSARLKLTLSYAGFLIIAGSVLLAAVWVFLLRYVPDGSITGPGPFVPNRSDLLRAFAPAAAAVMGFLLVFGLVGGWLLAGRMLAPLRRITQVARHTTEGALSDRIRLTGPDDEFRELADAFDAMLDRVEAHVAQKQRVSANSSHGRRTPSSKGVSIAGFRSTASCVRSHRHGRRAAHRSFRSCAYCRTPWGPSWTSPD